MYNNNLTTLTNPNMLKELIIVTISTISLTEIFTIFLNASYFYHIKCQSLSEVISLLCRNPTLICCILLAIPAIKLSNYSKQSLVRLTLCVITSNLLFRYLFDHMNTSLVFTDIVIIRNALPILFATVVSIKYFTKICNKVFLTYSVISIFLLLNYVLFFIQDFISINILPPQQFILKKSFQLIILYIFAIYYLRNHKEEYRYEK